mmetsp:Transcript_22808/g.57502  ORF Transcript_22808/g.57502 Transcript_22808/m.57502 type:complete len:397 (-) Transcript_22808:1435-2625(-)
MRDPPVVLDNGGCTIKVGLSGDTAPHVIPNCAGKAKGGRQWMAGDLLCEARDISGLSLKRPIDRGYVVNWDLEQEIWTRAFDKVMKIDPRGRTLLLTEPPLNLEACKSAAEEVVFEACGFDALATCTPAELVLPHYAATAMMGQGPAQACAGLVLDCGFSFTHAIPIFDGHVIPCGIRRVNVGGKVITNLLKEMVSYRSLNMMDETYQMELVKNAVSFVSADPLADLKVAKQRNSPLRMEYVLPDGVHNLRGFTRQPTGPAPRGAAASLEQTLMLANERFMPVEAVFRPLDIGMQQAGVAEVIVEAIAACPPQLATLLFSNIMLAGGTASCPGFKERLEAELRPLAPCDFSMSIHVAAAPELAAWHGGVKLSNSAVFHKRIVTRAEYEEHGRVPLH